MDDLAQFVVSTFGLAQPGAATITRANRGALGQIWQLSMGSNRYAVKELFTDRAPDEALIDAEVDVTEKAANAGVRVPRAHRSVDGAFAVPYADGRWIRLFDWLDLAPLDRSETAAQLGVLLARLHRAAPHRDREFDGGPPDPWFDVPPAAAIWPRHALAAVAAGVTWASALDEQLSRLADLTALSSPADPGRMRICHRDLHPDNVLDSGGELAVVDWDNLGPAEPGRELGKVLFDWFFERDVLDVDGASRMLAAYRDAGGDGRLADERDFGLLIAARLNFLDRQIGIALDPQTEPEHRAWAEKEIDEALSILPAAGPLGTALRLRP